MHLARAHLACAEAGLIGDGSTEDDDGVGRHLDEAERLLALHPDPSDLAVVRRLRALHAARAGRFDEAERLGQEALDLTEELPNEHGQAWWAIGEARAGAGEPDADDAFRHAIDVLRDHGTVRNYANVLRAYGRHLRDTGREREALDVFERAADVASNLRAEPATAGR
jgi:tetratricopeptide (TPR) repeat protein